MNNGRDCAHGRQVGKFDTCDLIDAEQRILELEAQVEQLRKPLSALVKVCHDRGGSLEEDGEFAYKVKAWVFKSAKTALDATPAQCLAEIKAQAVEDFIFALCLSDVPVVSNEVMDFSEVYANQLRQQANHHHTDIAEQAVKEPDNQCSWITKWISVNDGLPADKDKRNRASFVWVITASKCGNVGCIAFDPHKQIFTDECAGEWVDLTKGITHWMPLPPHPTKKLRQQGDQK